MTSALTHYRTSLLATLAVLALGVWPVPIVPLAESYVAICARYLSDMPFGHHYPPLAVALLAPVIVALAAGSLFSAMRQAWRQHRLDAAAAARQVALDPARRRLLRSLGLTGRVRVTSDQTVYAFCGGLARPRIYLSQGLVALLTPDELEAVLRHERQHLARRDPLRYFVIDLLSRLAPFLPALATWRDRTRVFAELAADQSVLAALPVEVLASALLKVMRASPPAMRRPAVAALSPDQARVAALTGQPITLAYPRFEIVASAAFGIAALGVLVWLTLQPMVLSAVCEVCPGWLPVSVS